MAEAFAGKYLSLTSFKRDGKSVATPVWFVQENGRLFVRTGAESGKVKRIRRDQSVTVALCTPSGRLRSEPVRARAEILPEREAQHVDELMAHKYRLERIFVLPLYRAVQRLRRRGAAETHPALLRIIPEQRR